MTLDPSQPVLDVVTGLVDAWCDRRCLKALRSVLQGWPLASGLTDEWAQLGNALKDVRALAKGELTNEEAQAVDAAITAIDRIVSRN